MSPFAAASPQVPAPLIFSVDAAGDRSIVFVRGELDLDSAPLLQQTLAEALTRTEGGLELDLSGVAFCDCSTLNVLLHLHHRARERAKGFQVRATSPAVERLLTLTGTHTLLTQEPPPHGGQPTPGPQETRQPPPAPAADPAHPPTARVPPTGEPISPPDDSPHKSTPLHQAPRARAVTTQTPDMLKTVLTASA